MMVKIFESPAPHGDDHDDGQDIPVPPAEHPPVPIEDPPYDPDQAPIDEGPKGPKQIV